MLVGLAQINPTVGDIAGNTALILKTVRDAEKQSCDLVVFPELVLTGYPPEDLLLKPAFIKDNLKALKNISSQIRKTNALIGFVDQKNNQRFNAAAWIVNGKIVGIYHKQCLPNYGVFDEQRYFTPGHAGFVHSIRGIRIGVTICEDIWLPGPHLKRLKKMKPDVVVNISASPFHVGKLQERHNAFKKQIQFLNAPLLYCNMVGGQDELVFDGGSFGTLAGGRTSSQFPLFQENLFIVDLQKNKSGWSLQSGQSKKNLPTRIDEIHLALIAGIHDYVHKNGFKKVALGISGGIDSALVAALAVEALGADNVVGVTMPSRYNLAETKNDAVILAKNLGIKLLEIPIQSIFQEFLKALQPSFENAAANIAEENLQARIRGSLLMALSNKFGWLILTTGNKSEMSTGYCTLYGDTAGGFAVIKDVLKTTVYDLARFINVRAKRDIIPQSTIQRPPTAELRENQRDEDSLGPYAELDPVIIDYVEKNRSLAQQKAAEPGKEAYIQRILSMIDRNEYKRRQAPPGIKITPHSFGRDHRMPITNRYKST